MIQATQQFPSRAAAIEPRALAIEPRRMHHARLAAMAQQVTALRRKALWMSVAAAAVLALCGLAALDYFAELSLAMRAFGLASSLLLAAVAWRVRDRLRFSTSDAAAAVETAWPELGQRMRTSHDYQLLPEETAPADQALVAALESDADRFVRGRAIEPLVNRWPLRAATGGLALVLLGWLFAGLAVPEFRISTARSLLLPAHYTEVELGALPDSLMLGEQLNVGMLVRGRPLEEAKVWQRNLAADGRPVSAWTPVEVQPQRPGPLVGQLTAVIQPQQSFEVRIDAGPRRHPLHTVVVRQPLTIEAWTVRVEPPNYTGLPASDGEAESLSIPAGSSLEFTARYNRAPQDVSAHVEPDGTTGPLHQTLDQAVSTISLGNVRETFSLRLQGRAADGVTDDSYPLRVRVVPDEPPLVVFSSPAEDAEALPTQEVTFAVEASDDYGLSRVGIIYKINGGEEISLWEQTLEGSPKQVRHLAILPLEDRGLSFHDAITYYAFVEDNRPEMQRTLSELRFLDIRPFRREYEVQDASSGTCLGECLALEKLIGEQREILKRTFAAQLREDAKQGPELAQAQTEVKEKLESLAGALAHEVGPIPALETAVSMMVLAADALQKQDLASGAAMEEDALADMILARRNLRKILKQGSSAAKQARQIDRQETQQLRLPPKKQETQQEQLGELRRELEQLAREQQQFAQSVSQLSGDAPEAASSRVDLIEQQIVAAKQASSLRDQFASGAFGQLAERRMQEVEELIDGSARQVAAARDDASVQGAKQAASTLLQLSEHLARRSDPDFDRKLSNARRAAERLAGDQRALNEAMSTASGQSSQPDVGRDTSSHSDPQQPQAGETDGPVGLEEQQQRLAGRGEEFADLLNQMHADAADPASARLLAPALAAHPPSAVAAAMRSAAESLGAGQPAPAAREGQRAEKDLGQLAVALRGIEAHRGDAKLQKLVEAERRAGELMDVWQRAGTSAEQALAAAQTQRLAVSIQPLAHTDAELAKTIQSLQALLRPAGAPSSAKDLAVAQEIRVPEDALATPPQTAFEGLRTLDTLLQKRIQEAILAGSLQQTDEGVPSDYIPMVEEYYRALSQDIE